MENLRLLSDGITVAPRNQYSINTVSVFILLHKKFLQFDWVRAVVFQLNFEISTCENYKTIAGSSINK